MANENLTPKSIMTTIRLPEHLHRAIKENNLCLTDIVIEALETALSQVEDGINQQPTPDERVDAALNKLDGDPDIAEYLISAKRIHRKVVSYVYGRVEWESGVILSTRQKERVRGFIEDQFVGVRDEVWSRHPALDEITGQRLGNFITNTGYRHRIEAEGKTPELLREIGERFVQASGPVKPTPIESIINHLTTSR